MEQAHWVRGRAPVAAAVVVAVAVAVVVVAASEQADWD